MAAQGSGGAFEISQRMTAMLGWGATVDFKEDWTWDQAADTYALDPKMAAKLKAANPEVRRLPGCWMALPCRRLTRARGCPLPRDAWGM